MVFGDPRPAWKQGDDWFAIWGILAGAGALLAVVGVSLWAVDGVPKPVDAAAALDDAAYERLLRRARLRVPLRLVAVGAVLILFGLGYFLSERWIGIRIDHVSVLISPALGVLGLGLCAASGILWRRRKASLPRIPRAQVVAKRVV